MKTRRVGRFPAVPVLVAGYVSVMVTACAQDPTATDDQPLPGASVTTPGAGGLSGDVTVLAAASLTDVFTELGTRFGAENPAVSVTFSFGASSELATHVVEGAPADVLATASETTMETVTDAGLADGEPVVFVTNVLEIVVPSGNPGGVAALADLADPELVVALCAPQVPCGAAAERLLELAGVVVVPDSLEEDVRAALTKVELGEVDAALVYRTDVIAAGDAVEGIEIAEAGDVVNSYPVVALMDAGNPDAAAAFVAYVRSPEAAAIFEAAGFGVP